MAVKKSKNPALEVAKAIDEAMTLVGSRLYREARLVLEHAQQVANKAGIASGTGHPANVPNQRHHPRLADEVAMNERDAPSGVVSI